MKDKDFIEKVIWEYKEKIFGFALSKLKNITDAEELASRILYEVYTALLKMDNVQSQNIAGFVYKVSENICKRFWGEEAKYRKLLKTPYDDFFIESNRKDSKYLRLESEISYLGKIQREIVVMHYFEKKKLKEIAKKLDMPLGTVKKHLYNARNRLKETISMPDENRVKMIKFAGVAHHGSEGVDGENIGTYMSNLSRQNIAYCVYHKAKTISEIAKDLCIPAAYIEDEIDVLVELGYIDKISGNRYLTNIMITEPSKAIYEKKHQIFMKYAKHVCDMYIPLLFKAMKGYDIQRIYTPKNDFNFLMWSIVSFTTGFKLAKQDKKSPLQKFYVRRSDGGVNIAFAWLKEDFDVNELSYVQKLYNVHGEINSYYSDKKLSWQFNTTWDSRPSDWQNYDPTDFDDLYEIIKGKVTKEPANVEKYKSLYDKGYLVSQKGNDYINLVVVSLPDKEFLEMFPKMSVKLKNISKELDAEIYEIDKTQYPERFHNLCRACDTDLLTSTDIRTRVLDNLQKNKQLKPLTKIQKMSVNTILFSDVLPTNIKISQ
ncbi:MAG: sigma-70 family RNA polymerase sigma factor [Candidatus Cloacimonetes bacterium]|nr:sigma-70 family RNA polymerase sigma factor [Candidatus Cloacimonadota bacterium]